MPKQEGQKSKLVTLLRILEQRTDENHRLNVPQLVQLLENQGILAERKSIYSDIDTLRSLGYDIQLQRGRGGGYWMASRAFELSELKLLVDAVQSSSVISARTSKRIIHKLEALCSDYEGTQLQRQVYVDGRPKTDSQTLLYSIDALHTAINRGCLVQFRYKGSSAVRTVSPWQLAWENGCYYLIAYQDEKAPPVRHYRVDRMAGVLVLDEPRRGKEFFRTFDLPAYLRKHFNMFGGTEYRVTLRCAADLEPVMRERFGREPVFCPVVSDFYSGMQVTVPLFAQWLKPGASMQDVRAVYQALYTGPVVSYTDAADAGGFLSAAALAGKDSMQIAVAGNEERMLLLAVYDNLGKGASGAAVECMNLVTGAEKTLGLEL